MAIQPAVKQYPYFSVLKYCLGSMSLYLSFLNCFGEGGVNFLGEYGIMSMIIFKSIKRVYHCCAEEEKLDPSGYYASLRSAVLIYVPEKQVSLSLLLYDLV